MGILSTPKDSFFIFSWLPVATIDFEDFWVNASEQNLSAFGNLQPDLIEFYSYVWVQSELRRGELALVSVTTLISLTLQSVSLSRRKHYLAFTVRIAISSFSLSTDERRCWYERTCSADYSMKNSHLIDNYGLVVKAFVGVGFAR